MYFYLSIGPAYEKYVFLVPRVRVSNVLNGKVAVSLQKDNIGT